VTAPTLAAGRVDVAGVSTAVIDTGMPVGAAAPPVLLLHGSGPGVTAFANWRPIIPALAASRRVVAPDQLGFGGTATGEPRTYGRTAWTGHALALLDTLGIGTVDIIGNSMGGAIALSISVARPGAVRRLVLMGSMGVAMALPSGLDAVWGYTPVMRRRARSSGCSPTTATSSRTSSSSCATEPASTRPCETRGRPCSLRRGNAGWTT
jgi:pimeloyl-ACP methyl ester carboxylesterase